MPPTISPVLHLHTGNCAECSKPLGRYHTYIVEPAACLSRLTECPPLHYDCAREVIQRVLEPELMDILWVVKSSSLGVPTARAFNDGLQDWLHLFTPERIEFLTLTGNPASYAEIEYYLQQAVREAGQRAGGNAEQEEAIAHQIAWLHKFLPPRTPSRPAEPPVEDAIEDLKNITALLFNQTDTAKAMHINDLSQVLGITPAAIQAAVAGPGTGLVFTPITGLVRLDLPPPIESGFD